MRKLLWSTLIIGLLWGAVGLARPGGSSYTEPVVLSTKDGVLEVTLTARQGQAKLDTAAEPVENMLLFGYEVKQGQASNGKLSDRNLYPGPTLNVQPGETLIVHLENQMINLTIDDFFDPAYVPKGQKIPLEPKPMARPDFNLHTHGLHVSPEGNSDNVLLSLEAGARNTYTFNIPKSHAPGLYWYHGHLHGFTALQTYGGLAGLLVIGRADGSLPAVTQGNLPVRTMALQYNSVFNRKGGQHKLNNPSWGMWVNTERKPAPGELESGAYQPSLAPTNFDESAAGTRYVTNWWAGPLDIDNHRGQFALVPNNFIRFKGKDGQVIEPDPTVPDQERDVQYTVNGLFQPKLESKPGQTEIWVLSNVSDLAYMPIRLTETATGKHPSIIAVGMDGVPFRQAQNMGDYFVLSPASRIAIAVTIPATGELVLDMPPATNLPYEMTFPGVVYTSRGPGQAATGALGNVTVDPQYISYFDGFFLFPTQVLLRASAAAGTPAGNTVSFEPGQDLGAHTYFFDTQKVKPAVKRSLIINGGFLDEKANPQDPKAFIYAFNSLGFPNCPLLRPRLNTVEEWTFLNYNNDEHPIHIHVNDFQVTELVDPVLGKRSTFWPWAQDNVNLPAPKMGPRESVIEAGKLSLRTHFEDFIGTYVTHCHRLNHEDNGLMTIINVIPSVSSYASAARGVVTVRDGQGDKVLARVTPFAGYTGPLAVAMGDVNRDTVYDLIVGGPGEVAVYSGKAGFATELARFAPFGASKALVSVAAGNMDGNPGADNIVVGSGRGMKTRVVVFSSKLPALGSGPELVGDFSPYPDQQDGVTIAVGMLEAHSGRNSIVTAPGPGHPALVRAFRYELENEWCNSTQGPTRKGEFLAFDKSYTGGVSLGCDWLNAMVGGAQMVVVGQSAGAGEVRVYSTGSALDGFPELYTKSFAQHNGPLSFRSVAKVPGFKGGVSVGTTSTVSGGDVLVGGPAEVRKYSFSRARPKDSFLTPRLASRTAGGALVGGD